MDEMDDDHFDDLLGNSGGRGWACHRGFLRSAFETHSLDYG